jgi:hypothetical protein
VSPLAPVGYGIWDMVYGIWCMVYGVWCMVYGIWCIVYGVLYRESREGLINKFGI